ncbi:MAG: glycosyltransferase family 4 protein, partial [bacterium]
RTAEFLKDFPIPKILDLDDMLSIRYKRQLELKERQTNPFGQYARQLPSLASKVLNSRFVQRMVLKYESRRLARYEIAISRQFDAIVLVSALETDLLNEILGEKKAFAVPAGVEMSLFDPGQKEKSGNIISFLGLYSSSHNEDTALHLCHNILPEIKKSVPDVKLRLIGGGLTKRIEDLAKNPSVEVTGKVPAVQDYLRTSKVFVAPFRFGSGVKTKILEAMALKLPVVTNSIGEEGMNIENKGILVVEDDPRDFVKAVVRLLQDEALREELGEKGRRFVIENFAYTQTMKQWAKVLSHLDSRCSRTSGA